jgi:hypothetical protein
MSNPEAPDLTFEAMTIGDVYADTMVEVTDAVIDRYREAIATGLRKNAESTFAPPTMAAMWTVPRVMFRDWNVPVGGLHAGQRWESVRPVKAGDRLRVRVSVKEKTVRKGRPWVVFESRLTDPEGSLVARGEMTIVWPQ